MLRPTITLTSLLVLASTPALADVRLPAVLGDHMVLQRESEATLWGWAAPAEEVEIVTSWGVRAATAADEDGRWRVAIETPEAGGPHQILISGTANELALDDVLIGEVWICSGQSNMEWTLGPGVGPGIADWQEEVASAYHEQIRLFDVPNTIAAGPQEECGGQWLVCSPETVSTFSAVGYLFGRELANELNVPVGLVSTNWGGTVAEAWTSREGLAPFPAFADDLERLARIAEDPAAAQAELESGWAAWWANVAKKDPLSRETGWMEARFGVDDRWGTMKLPAMWEPELGNFDGIVWFTREFDLPEEYLYRDLVLELGAIDDMDTTWVNGVQVGVTQEYGRHATPRKYTVPLRVPRPERNVVAVRALDTGGAGGFGGQPSDLYIGPADSDERVSLAGEWHYHLGASMKELGSPPARSWMHQNRPTVLYNAMIAPLLPLQFKGAIWYQGESNRTRAAQYRELFPAMIADWRRTFSAYPRRDFPFYYVQIAPFAYGGDTGEAAELREAQTMAMSLPSTGMAVTMDIGNPQDIHPANKQDVGRRLALWALAKDYGVDVAYCGPLYRAMKAKDGAIELAFDHAEGLHSNGEPLRHFTIAGADRVFHPAEAAIDGEEIVVRADAVPAPVAVRFAWGAADMTNLWNGAGLPAPSFRTDDWERQ